MTDSPSAPEPPESPNLPVPPVGDEVDEAYRPMPMPETPRPPVLPAEPEEEPSPPRLDEDRQLSIRQMLVVLALVSGLFGLLRLLPASLAAFIMALLLVGGLVASVFSGPFNLIAHVLWWGVFVVWLVMCLVAAGIVQ